MASPYSWRVVCLAEVVWREMQVAAIQFCRQHQRHGRLCSSTVVAGCSMLNLLVCVYECICELRLTVCECK